MLRSHSRSTTSLCHSIHHLLAYGYVMAMPVPSILDTTARVLASHFEFFSVTPGAWLLNDFNVFAAWRIHTNRFVADVAIKFHFVRHFHISQ